MLLLLVGRVTADESAANAPLVSGRAGHEKPGGADGSATA